MTASAGLLASSGPIWHPAPPVDCQRTLLSALAALALAGVSGCGGESLQEPRPNDPEATVERTFTTTNPFDCETIATERFLERAFGSHDRADNILRCKAQVATGIGYADEVVITNTDDSGGRVEFEVSIAGGDVDKQNLTVTVVDRGWWQVSDIDGYEPTVAAQSEAREQAEAELRKAKFPRQVRECMVETMAERLPRVSIQGLHGGLPPDSVSAGELADECR